MKKRENWVGQVLSGRYQVTGQLGEGGMGVVYKARDQRLGCDVVLKVPHASMAADPDFVARFTREIRSLVQLSHPHIVKVLDVGSHAGLPFAVMQFLPAGSLRQRQTRAGGGRHVALVPGDLRAWLPQVAVALDYIHGRQYVHRDVKPENILFDQAGHAFLADFGIVKALGAEDKKRLTALTGTGMVLGTPHYLAPEVIAGKAFDGRADQYALAVTAYELLCGRVPFDGASGPVVYALHLTQPPSPLEGAAAGLSAALCAAVHRGLFKDPRQRFPTCAAFAEAVLGGLAGGAAAGTTQVAAGPPAATVVPAPAGRTQRYSAPAAPTQHAAAPASLPVARVAATGVTAKCPRCGRVLTLAAPGEQVQCPGCRATLKAPAPKAPPRTSDTVRQTAAWDELTHAEKGPVPRRSRARWLWVGGLAVALAVAVPMLIALNSDKREPPPGETDKFAGGAKDKKRPEKEKQSGKDKQSGSETPPGPEKPLRELHDHAEFISAVACYPEGHLALSGGGGRKEDGRIVTGDAALRIWDLDSGKVVARLEGHTDNVRCLAIAPNGRRAASGGDGGNIYFWDLEGRRKEKSFRAHGTVVEAVAFSPGGHYLASAGFDGVVSVWEAGTGKDLLTLSRRGPPVFAVVFSADGRYLFSGGHDKLIRKWDVARGVQVAAFRGHEDAVYALALSPDGKTLASGSGSREESQDLGLRLWDLEGNQLAHLPTPGRDVRGAAFTPDGKHLLSCGRGSQTSVWDFATRKLAFLLGGHEPWGRKVAATPDGKYALTCGTDRVAKLWRLPEPGPLVPRPRAEDVPLEPEKPHTVHTFGSHTEAILAVACSPDGRFGLTGGGGRVVEGNRVVTGLDLDLRLWDLVSGKLLARLPGHTDNVQCLAIAPDSTRAASGDADGKIIFWDLQNRRKRWSVAAHRRGVDAVAFSPLGSYLASGGRDGLVRLWDVKTGELLLSLEGHGGQVFAVLFTLDGKQMFSGGFDKTIRLWDLAGGRPVSIFRGHRDPVRALALSPDGRTLLSGSGWGKGPDPGLRLWDLEGNQLAHLPTPEHIVFGVAFTPDGKHFLSCGQDHQTYLWDLETKTIVSRETGHTSWVTSLALSPDGSMALTGSYDRTARLWRLPPPGQPVKRPEPGEVKPAGKPAAPPPPPPGGEGPRDLIRRFDGHTEAVWSVAATEGGKLALSGGGGKWGPGGFLDGDDHSLLLWEIDTGTVRHRLQGHKHIVRCLALLPGGKQALSAGAHGELFLWDLAPGKRLRSLVFTGPGTIGDISSVVVSRNGKRAWTGGGALVRWDLETYQGTRVTLTDVGYIHAVALSPKGLLVACGDDRGQIFLPLRRGRFRRLVGPTDVVWSLSFSPDGKYLAAGYGSRLDRAKGRIVPGKDNTVRIWEVATGRELKKFEGHTSDVRSVVFSPDGKRVLSGSRDGFVYLWGVESGKRLAAFKGHGHDVQQVAFVGDGRRALSAAFDGKVCLWRLPTPGDDK